MSESEEPLLSPEELSAIEDMGADGKFGSEKMILCLFMVLVVTEV